MARQKTKKKILKRKDRCGDWVAKAQKKNKMAKNEEKNKKTLETQ